MCIIAIFVIRKIYSPPIFVFFDNIDLFKKDNDLFPEMRYFSLKSNIVASLMKGSLYEKYTWRGDKYTTAFLDIDD